MMSVRRNGDGLPVTVGAFSMTAAAAAFTAAAKTAAAK
jgi:hypothetical protein